MTVTDLRPPSEADHATGPVRVVRDPVEGTSNTLQWGGLCLLLVLLIPLRELWWVQAVLVVGLLTVPGRLTLSVMRIGRLGGGRQLLYSVALSTVVLSVMGLAVDGLGQAVGASRPLNTGPLSLGLVVTLALLVYIATQGPVEHRPRMSVPQLPWPDLAVLLLPLLAVVGAARLNNGGGGAIAILAEVCVVVVLAALFLPASRFGENHYVLMIWAACTAAVWSFSLRGDLVYGYDISAEYHLTQQTVTDGVWNLQHVDDAYGAMLSLTVLPAALHSLAGPSVLMLFKVVYPVVLALVPVGAFLVARRFVPVRWACIAPLLIMGQSFFFSSMPAVARQEIGLLLFVVLIDLLAARSTTKRAAVLIAIVAVGLVLSHYSTAYLAAAVTVLAVVFAALRAVRIGRPAFSIGLILAACALVVGCFAWYGGLTHSAGNLGKTTTQVQQQGLNLLPFGDGNPLQSFLVGNVPGTASPQEYQAELEQTFRSNYPYVTPQPESVLPQFDLQGTTEVSSPRSAVTSDTWALILAIANQVVNVGAIVGVAFLLFAPRRRLPFGIADRKYASLALAVLLFVAVVRLSGTLASQYNQERAAIQALVVLVVPLLCLGRFFTAPSGSGDRRSRHELRSGTTAALISRAVPGSLAAIGLILLVNSTGLSNVVLTRGGQVNVAASNEDTERFVQAGQDVEAASWLGSQLPSSSALVYADRYGALRWLAATGRSDGLITDVTPQTLDKDAWIYAYTANTTADRARATTSNGSTVLYAWPAGYVTSHYDRIYDNGTAEIFH